MNLIEFGVEDSGDHHPLPFEAMHQIGPVKAVHIFSGGEDEIAAQMLDAIYRASVRRAAHRF